MAIDFSKIQNQQLQNIIKKLPYFEIFPDPTAQHFIDEIVEVPAQHQEKLIQLFEKQIATLPKLNAHEKTLIFEAESANLLQMIKDFKKETLIKGEKVDQEESTKQQENLLSQLDTL